MLPGTDSARTRVTVQNHSSRNCCRCFHSYLIIPARPQKRTKILEKSLEGIAVLASSPFRCFHNEQSCHAGRHLAPCSLMKPMLRATALLTLVALFTPKLFAVE